MKGPAQSLAPPSGLERSAQLCAFFVGAEEYAIDLLRVEEILQLQRVIPVPNAPAFVEGVVTLRGGVVPVVDLRKRLAAGPPNGKLKPKLMVCWVGRRRVALLVDGVSEVVWIRRSEIKPSPPLAAPGASPYVVGVWGEGAQTKLLLNVKALLQVTG